MDAFFFIAESKTPSRQITKQHDKFSISERLLIRPNECLKDVIVQPQTLGPDLGTNQGINQRVVV